MPYLFPLLSLFFLLIHLFILKGAAPPMLLSKWLIAMMTTLVDAPSMLGAREVPEVDENDLNTFIAIEVGRDGEQLWRIPN